MWREQTRILDAAFAGGILLLVIGSVLVVFKPQLQHLEELRERERDLLPQLAWRTQVQSGLGHLRKEVAAIQRRLEEFDQQLPLNEQLDSYLRQIDEVSKRTGFDVLQIKPGTLRHEKLFSQLPIAITAEAPFPEFYGFLSALYDIPRLTKVESLSVTRRPDSDICDITLSLMIYVARALDETSGN